MRFKLLSGLCLAVVLSAAAVALAGGFTKSPVAVAADQPCCKAVGCCPECIDCCPECAACCATDGCCEECVLCCIEMGCDPSCCFPAAAAKAEPKACKPTAGCTSGSCCK